MSIIKKQYFHLLFILLGCVIFISPYVLFPICSDLRPDGNPMSCYYTAKLVMVLGCVLTLINVVALIKKNKLIGYFTYLTNITIAFIGIALPNRVIAIGDMKTMGWQIAYCKKPMMACNHGLKPALNIMLPLIIILSILAIIENFLRSSDNV